MALLIADIGGSSSRWAVIGQGVAHALPGPFPGFNPSSGDPGAMQETLRTMDLGAGAGHLDVVAYGAGCGHPVRAARMHEALAAVWPLARIEVGTDLLGAARSLYGRAPGLVLILGTGMNAGFFDGAHLRTPMPSLGYVLGDEGSGADIGKHLLRDALHGVIPPEIGSSLFPNGPILSEVLEAVYRSPAAQAYVASFAGALAGHVQHNYVHDLLSARFVALAQVLGRYHALDERHEVRAIGSVATGFRSILETTLAQFGMQLTAAVRDPLPGLLAYHAPVLS